MPHPYDAQFIPPFPVLPIQIRAVGESGGSDQLMAQVDTGADATLVPVALINAIGAEEYDNARVRSHWGEYRNVSLYLVDMEIAGETLPGVEVVADEEGADVLLGRNILNRLILLLDGYRLQAEVLTRYPERL